MFTSNAALWVGVAVLVLVASLPAPGRRPVLPMLLTFLVALLAGAAVVHYRIDAEKLILRSPISQRALYASKEFAKPREKNVLVIDGGSYASRAIDHHLLKVTLAHEGYSTRIVHLGIGAANHFERYSLYQRVVRHLHGRKRKKGQRWIYLAEVHRGYDVEPLSQFNRNRDTERAYDYMNAKSAWLALRATFTRDIKLDAHPWRVRSEILRHAAINAFNVGLSSMLCRASKVKPDDGHVAYGAKRGRPFSGLGPLLKELDLKDHVKIPPWVFDIREREEDRLWGPFMDRWIYFGVPSTHPGQLRYIRNFCEHTKRLCIQPANRRMLSELNSKEYWLNPGHLSTAGARIYTLWLAERLIHTGVLRR
ncbi:MAG TPA: hypothetical protein VHM70_05210 [Polyangiaceae bacterium]|nr:hypothetical protein [Polyangiaceae bacterium]